MRLHQATVDLRCPYSSWPAPLPASGLWLHLRESHRWCWGCPHFSLSSCRIAAPSAAEGIGLLLLKGKKRIKSGFLQGWSWMSPSPASCTMCEIWCIFLAMLLPLSCPRIQEWSQVWGSPGEKADGCMWPGKCVWMASNQQWLCTAGCPCSAHLP